MINPYTKFEKFYFGANLGSENENFPKILGYTKFLHLPSTSGKKSEKD